MNALDANDYKMNDFGPNDYNLRSAPTKFRGSQPPRDRHRG